MVSSYVTRVGDSETVCSPLIYLRQQRPVCSVSGRVGPKKYRASILSSAASALTHQPVEAFTQSKPLFLLKRLPKKEPILTH